MLPFTEGEQKTKLSALALSDGWLVLKEKIEGNMHTLTSPMASVEDVFETQRKLARAQFAKEIISFVEDALSSFRKEG
jgi:hypothetical protein